MVLLFILDLMGMSASVLGMAALLIYNLSGDYRFDGLGAILIGVVLAFFAIILLIGTAGVATIPPQG